MRKSSHLLTNEVPVIELQRESNMLEPTKLPSRFPCWVRAKFSYGGESKHDLGFMEGDLIECLNAGDGSWWMGRLWRDKRVKGLFPSNFVEVLDANFRPAVRATSPMPNRSPSTSPFNPQPPRNTKSKLSRKPYQSYSAPAPPIKKPVDPPRKICTPPRALSPAPLLRNTQPRVQSQVRRFESNTKPPSSPLHYGYRYDGIYTPSRVENNHNLGLQNPGVFSREPSIHSNINPRVPSPLPMHHEISSHVVSPQPEANGDYYYRTPSPHSPVQYEFDDRHQPILMDPQLNSASSSPPPAPPPHRVIYTPNIIENVQNSQENYETKPRAPTPTPPSSRGTGMTPSPLRSAMDDVMSSLADMGIPHNEPSSEVPLNPWSPEAFDQTYSRAWRNNESRLKNSNRYQVNEDLYKEEKSQLFQERTQPYQVNKNPPLLSNYVQRMESRLNRLHADNPCSYDEDRGPAVPPKAGPTERPKSCIVPTEPDKSNLKHRRSAYDVGKSMLGRTYSTKTNITSSSSGTRSTTTNTTSSTQYTNRSLMSGPSAGGISNTSAGSLERKRAAAAFRSHSAFGTRKEITPSENNSLREIKSSRSDTPPSGISYHSSHASEIVRSNSKAAFNVSSAQTGTNILGGLTAPKPRKSGFFKKIIESAKTGAASARNSIAVGDLIRSNGTTKNPDGVTSISGGLGSNPVNDSSRDKVVETDWVQVRRDVNRSNSLSRIERMDRKERCQMMDYLTIDPIDELYRQCDGDEGVDGNSVPEATDFQLVNFTLVDKNTRMINSLPPMTNPISLATGFVCRPYRSDVQRLRAIFTWVSEKIAWEEEFESEIDPRRVIQSKRGSAQEVAFLVMEMCTAVGIHAEVVHGYLKTPGEALELNFLPRANHWWNAILIDGEWRIMDCSLASPSNPYRCLYTSASSQTAESWWFLARPIKICWTHIPENQQQQHLSPQVSPQILLALPCACPPFFKNDITLIDYDTSLVRIEDLELVHIKFTVPADVECVAEVEAKTFTKDTDGDFFETGDVVKKRALAQAEWVGGQKRYTVKALLPGDEGHGALKIYVGKRGLMHSIKDIPHPLAFALPINHTGDNPPYEFFTRYPTPHAQRHDLYVVQPQCQMLALNNTFVFAIRQHPSSHCAGIMNFGSSSTVPQPRPSSAFSMNSTSATGSYSSGNFSYTSTKPAKLAIQSPAGKVLRLMRKEERNLSTSQAAGEKGDGGIWETIIKVGEKGMWRGLVLADRTARWCVFAEWSCI